MLAAAVRQSLGDGHGVHEWVQREGARRGGPFAGGGGVRRTAPARCGPLRITVPVMRPVILFTVVIPTINGLQSFAAIAANAGPGGPGQAGLTTLLYFYQSAFLDNDHGYGAAVLRAFFVLILVLVLINWRVVQRGRKT